MIHRVVIPLSIPVNLQHWLGTNRIHNKKKLCYPSHDWITKNNKDETQRSRFCRGNFELWSDALNRPKSHLSDPEVRSDIINGACVCVHVYHNTLVIEGSQCAFGSCALGPKSGVQLSVCGRGSGGTVASDPQNARKLHKRILKTVYTS